MPRISKRDPQYINVFRYADDFLLIHHDLNVVQRCRELISEWLKDMGLELKPSKTRIAHTLIPEQSEDRKAGFDFLGYHIRQYRVGKYKSSIHPSTKEKLGFRTLITPSKSACKKHQQKIRDVFKKHKYSHQAKLIVELNPIIRGWTNYYSFSDAQTTGVLSRQDNLVYLKLRAWSRHRTGDWLKAKKKYWTTIGNNHWIFATKKGDENPLRLLTHTEVGSSSTEYVKVQGEASPFDGNLIYWSTRMGRNPDMPSRKASLLKIQKGICPWCCLHFREGDLLETDHNIPLALGGKDEYKNLQLLHGHCHDEKTAHDLEYIRNQRFMKYMDYINQTLDKSNWFWNENDILIVL
jgi:RNA-directed DNA polymerase